MGNTFIFPEGALAAESKDDQAVMSGMIGVNLKLVALLHKILY